MFVTALEEITCNLMYYMSSPFHIRVSGYVQLERVPVFSPQIYKIDTLVMPNVS